MIIGGGADRRHRPDYVLVLLTVLLLAIGIIVVFSISPALAVEKGANGGAYVTRQLIAIAIGAVLFGVMAQVPLERWRQLYKPLLLVAAVVTLVAVLMPVNPQYPAHRWIRFGGFSFQSVELLKFGLLIWLSGFLAARMKAGLLGDWQKTLKPLIVALVGIGFIVAFVQSDLGSLGVIIAMMVIMAFVAGLPMRKVAIGLAVIGFIGFLAISTTPYRRDRLAAFLHPENSCMTTGYQACQALIAVGSGGMMGLGLGRSVQAYGYLPEAENDSIFAIYAEKFGFLGVTALLALFVALFTRIKHIAERAPDNFSRLVVVGILAWLTVQTMINIGAMIGLLPLKGITLPLISYGGSSVIMVMAVLGLVFQVSRYTVHRLPETSGVNRGGGNYEDRSNRRRVRGTHYPGPGSRA